MKVVTLCLTLLAAFAAVRSISIPIGSQLTGANLIKSTMEHGFDNKTPFVIARPVSDVSARGLAKLKDIFDPLKKMEGDKDKKPKGKPENGKDKDKENEKGSTDRKTSTKKKKFKFKDNPKQGGGGISTAATGPKAPLLFLGALFVLVLPLMVL
ncbi:predicted protein [Histoplasma capsulatum G186AR]|uniref:Uncharacterized protein n=1 Tax=Ajellomyces capsulatus (strain G186AR / H82 / ATCC MYA-2454 / RMSCC 2432) TaxID=447093 RepID=C0NST8_AJECG|nr:uncharacterized protein HCBG_06218 [Histoplasma capsulatum G186AR]EEH05954.1 predicted protein [Histoplasma capsulatum G186AR]